MNHPQITLICGMDDQMLATLEETLSGIDC